MASGWLRSRASVCNTSMPSQLSMSFRLVLRGKSHSQIHSPRTSSASRPYITGCTANIALRATDATHRETKASRHRHAGEFRIYNKLSQASRGFPKKVSLSITRNVGLVVKQVGGSLEKAAYVPEHQYVEEEDESPTSEAALAPLPPELQPVPIDDNLPQGNSDEAIQEFDSDYDSIDCFNSGLEDFDPAQDSTDYSPSSDETLEPRNAFGLGESSVFLTTPPSSQLQPKEDRHETAEGIIQYFEQVDSSESRRNPSTFEEPSIHEPELAPWLLIYSFTTPASASQNAKAAFLALTARYAFLTSVDEYRGFTAYKHRDSGYRWLVVQEFSQTDDFDPAWMVLKKMQAKHFWWKNGWENTSLAFYSLEGSRKSV